MKIIGISRVRNESLIIADTVAHMESICDGLIFYDDCSDDGTVEIIRKSAKKPVWILQGEEWRGFREAEETRHRALLLEEARKHSPDWIFCFDADERYQGNIREFLLSPKSGKWDAVRIRLFDAHLTPECQEPYRSGMRLEDLERRYGPERRDILMIWRNSPLFFYAGLDAREPRQKPEARVRFSPFTCKHFGKGISVEQWEETCAYYAAHFQEPYKTKWENRKGKAIHTASDYGRPLCTWEEVHANAIPIHPVPHPELLSLKDRVLRHLPRPSNRTLLASVVVAGAVLRLAGIDFGLPRLYDVDEPVFVNAAFHLFNHETLDPGWYGHPGTTVIYLLALLHSGLGLVSEWLGNVPSFAVHHQAMRADPATIHLFGRLLMAAFGIATIPATHALARRFVNERSAVFAAVLVAVAPTAIDVSLRIRTDSLLTLLTTLVLLYSLEIMKSGRARHYLAAGALAGLATATKYPGVVASIAIAIAHFFRNHRAGIPVHHRFGRLLLAALASLAAAFLASPYLFLSLGEVLKAVSGEAAQTIIGVESRGFLPTLGWFLGSALRRDFTLIGLAIGGMGAISLVRRDRKGAASVLLAFWASFLILISSFNVHPGRWMVPLIPVTAAFCAAGFESIRRLAEERLRKPKRVRRLSGALAVAIILPGLAMSMQHARERLLPDSRTIGAQWIESHIPAGSVLLMERYTPQLPAGRYRIRFPNFERVDELTGVTRLLLPKGQFGTLPGIDAILAAKADYIVLGNTYDRKIAAGQEGDASMRIYEELFRRSDLLFDSEDARQDTTGPRIRILRLR